MLTEEEKKERRRRFLLSVENAKKVLKPGDKCRGSHGCGPKRAFIFAGWDGNWIISQSGINDWAPGSVDRVNGHPVNFSEQITIEQGGKNPIVGTANTAEAVAVP